MSTIKYIKNEQTESDTYLGKSIAAGEYYLIPPVDEIKFANDAKILEHIATYKVVVASSDDELNDIGDIAKAINYLKNIEESMPRSEGQGNLMVEVHKLEGASFARATHDFCNKCTWFPNSVLITDEVGTTSDDLTYSFTGPHFIDVINGIINRQDLHQDKKITVKIDDVEVTSGFTIDHKQADVIFDSVQTGSTIKCTYWYPTNSQWSVEPTSGKMLIIEHSEVQFSEDVEMNVPVKFEIWISNPYFAVPGHPYEGMPKIPYEKVQYNSIRDIINESNLGTGYIPQVGDLPGNVLVFPFNYVTQKQLLSSYGAELVVSTIGDVELAGGYGTATFYLVSKDES